MQLAFSFSSQTWGSVPAGIARRKVTAGCGAGLPDCFTSSLYLLELTKALYVFSELNFFFVSGSVQNLDTGAPVLAASVSFLASNHSLVTGGMSAIFRLRLYLRVHLSFMCTAVMTPNANSSSPAVIDCVYEKRY